MLSLVFESIKFLQSGALNWALGPSVYFSNYVHAHPGYLNFTLFSLKKYYVLSAWNCLLKYVNKRIRHRVKMKTKIQLKSHLIPRHVLYILTSIRSSISCLKVNKKCFLRVLRQNNAKKKITTKPVKKS